MRPAAPSKDFSVYEFGADEEGVEAQSRKYARKAPLLAAPNKGERSRVTKDLFLQAFGGGSYSQSGVDNVFDVDADESNDSLKCNNSPAKVVKELGNDFVTQIDTSPVVDYFDSENDGDQIYGRNFGGEATVYGLSRMDSFERRGFSLLVPSTSEKEHEYTHLELQSCKSQVNVASEEDQTSEPTSPSTSFSDVEVNEGAIQDPTSDSVDSHSETENEVDAEVSFEPDYLTFGNKCSAQSLIRFCTGCIVIEVADICSGGYMHWKWIIDDLVHIKCQFNKSAGIARAMLILRQNSVEKNNCKGSEDLVKLEFAVSNPQWFELEEKILMLARRYKAVWNVTRGDLIGLLEDVIGMNSIFSCRHSLYEDDGSAEDVVYPRGDPDAVTISKRDVMLLDPETFINDTVIDFYIKFLKDRIPLEEKQRFHFFNSFFFRKLADDPEGISEGRAAFLRVRKWTRKVNIFEKDYIFIPVNYKLHWSLLVICHPNEVAYFREDNLDKASKIPCILHMDSIKGSHRGHKNLVQSYLSEEWKERFGELSPALSHNFANLRFVSLELPQQGNSYDCGLFLLHYVELFLEKAPVNFNPFRITKYSNFLNMDWFPPAEASNKRFEIRKLMIGILAGHSEVPSLDFQQSKHFDDEEKPSSGATGMENELHSSAVEGLCQQGGFSAQIAQVVTSVCTSFDHIELDRLEPSQLISNFFIESNKEDENVNELMQSESIRFQLSDEICTTSSSMEIVINKSQNVQNNPLEPKDVQDSNIGWEPSRSSECLNGEIKHASRIEVCQHSTEEREQLTFSRFYDDGVEIAALSPNTRAIGSEDPNICTQTGSPETSEDEDIQRINAIRIEGEDEYSTVAEGFQTTIACKRKKTEALEEGVQMSEDSGMDSANEDSLMAEVIQIPTACKRRKTVVAEESRRLTRNSTKG